MSVTHQDPLLLGGMRELTFSYTFNDIVLYVL
jgi:hypothetical protein